MLGGGLVLARVGRLDVGGLNQLLRRELIHRTVVHLEINREAVFGHTLDVMQALDDVQLPQRPAHIQGAGVKAGRQYAELSPVPGLRQRQVANMKIQVEFLVIDPVGIIDVTRCAPDLLREYRGGVKPVAGVLPDMGEAHLLGQAGLVVQVDQADVGGALHLLHEEEVGVF